MSKFLILLVLVCTVLVCSVVGKPKKRGGGCEGKKLQKKIKAYNTCLKQGFPSSLGCESSDAGKVKGKLLKKCKKLEKKLKKCAYSCEEEAEWEFKAAFMIRVDKETGEFVMFDNEEGLVALLFLSDDDSGVIGTLCGDYFNDHAADLLCQYMGYDKAASWGSHDDYRYITKAFLKQLEAPVVVDDVKCGPQDSNITDCDAKIMDHNCGHDQDVWLKCSVSVEVPDWSKEEQEGGTVVRVGNVESFFLRYHTSGDKYLISIDGAVDEESASYKSLVYKSDGIFRKVEYDWATVYLARTEGKTTESAIEWRIACSRPIKSAEISMSHTTFGNGKVVWSLDVDGETSEFHPQFSDIDLSKLTGATSFSIKAKLSGEEPAHIVWQHTQLFRAKLGSDDTPFSVDLTF